MKKYITLIILFVLFFSNISFAYSNELFIYEELKLLNKHAKKYKNIVINKKLSISEQSLKNINDYNKTLNSVDNKIINIKFSDDVSEQIKNEELSLIQDGLKFFQNYYYSKNLDGVIFTSNDFDWANNFLKNKFYNEWAGDVSKNYKNNEICNFAFAMQRSGYALCIDNKERKIFDKQTSIHEIFHIVQAQNSNQYKSNNFGMPCWLLEGSATYLGSAIGIKNLLDMNIFINNLKYNFNDGSGNTLLFKLNSNKSKDILVDLESTNECKLNLAPYTMGYLATEFLISKYGFEKFMTFIKSFDNNVYWKKDFELIFNLNIDLFYEEVVIHAKNSLV